MDADRTVERAHSRTPDASQFTLTLLPLGEKMLDLARVLTSDPARESKLFSASHPRGEPRWEFSRDGWMLSVRLMREGNKIIGVSLAWQAKDGGWVFGLYAGPGQFTDFLVQVRLTPDRLDARATTLAIPYLLPDAKSGDPLHQIEWDTNAVLGDEVSELVARVIPLAPRCVALFERAVHDECGVKSEPLREREPETLDDILRRFE